MRIRLAAMAALLLAALSALATPANAGPRSRRAAAALDRADAALKEISGHERAQALGAELEIARRWLDGAKAALHAGRSGRTEALGRRLDAQIALLRAMLAAAEAEASAEAAERSAFEAAGRIRGLERRYDALVLEARGAELTSAFPERKEAPRAP